MFRMQAIIGYGRSKPKPRKCCSDEGVIRLGAACPSPSIEEEANRPLRPRPQGLRRKDVQSVTVGRPVNAVLGPNLSRAALEGGQSRVAELEGQRRCGRRTAP